MTDRTPPRPALEPVPTPQVWAPGVFRIPLYRMSDLPFGFKASEQDRKKT